MGFADLQAFLDRGGPVLLVIMLATFFMWGLILERVFYFRFAHKQVAADAIAEWRSRSDRKSTLAHWVKDKLVSEVRMKAEQNVQLTKAMVALAPLLGLLGTVTGMVAVFDIMAITSGADAKAMSAGVSRATIPTMAGMVASLSGILFTSGMDRRVNRSVQQVEDAMEIS
ncbi:MULTISPECIES: MotA/TolQ/ExbB proton channel family protein [Hyphomonas]|jgi:biopolymer transport protein ExbB|uniref:Biopolymer transporter ExbB n=4 Tax=root TaxID=1 RepID=A0A3B9KZU3_9PROT|nr:MULTISPECIES: MotA/TolQ/ExbB proton channel family protein [Hyphomonas]MAN90623.1 biopolymer transporter ExbB [Hyphomonadaceae bacterium]MEE2922700.1 MotA/TolQ/ExbB proton channel family protein [Pseudomonadota bacterium]OUX84790.1 MAG: biopolymer transporter ExbB [Hyphomonas sp. TMED31]KCZ62997.1 biopolymer transporter ExbB [Hyphomonas sp. L-53-1-40]MAA81061.1 biopolymer transporter ExbB [Hyphomonas sp.]|tara:strand:+ start:2200 stop:2709 length:510 start_codon:yes stop_codon:yes gene_type:complete|mmetsp:Transcript_33810/g.86676  ORF Transcript_33810/g.86676 Transcript_33810/m.86676 type:complete len:170 (+) Transcript_33810:2576-3085(+)